MKGCTRAVTTASAKIPVGEVSEALKGEARALVCTLKKHIDFQMSSTI